MARPTTADPADDDIGALAWVVASGMNRRVEERLRRDGFPDVRSPHRDVVLGLLAGDTHVVALAGHLGRSPQAVSKSVTDLERIGCVERGRDPDDGRARPLVLTARGQALVDALRRAHRAETRDLTRWLGTRDRAELVRLLQHAAEHLRELPPR